MPKLIALPDGSTGSFPDDMGDDAIAAVLQKQFPASKPSALRSMYGDVAGDIAAGVGKTVSAASNAMEDINPVTALVKLARGGKRNPINQSFGDFADREYEAAGPLATGANIVSELALTAGPIGKVAQGISRVPLLAKALGRMAPAAGDVAANAAYSAARANEGERGTAALAGGAGAAGGRVLVRALGGPARPLVSKEAQTLIDNGVTPTPGQLFGDNLPGRMVRGLEDKMTSLPFAGQIISHARARSMAQYNNAEINKALQPLGVTIKGSGEEAVIEAHKLISSAYDAVLPQTYVTPVNAFAAIKKVKDAAQDIPLLSMEQEGKLLQFIARKLDPAWMKAKEAGTAIDGKTAKALDAEIGHLAREFSSHADPGQRPLGEAFYELQSAWRDALSGATPEAKAVLRRVNDASRQFLPVRKAANRALAQGGQFTPLQFERAAQSFEQGGSELNRAARGVLPSTIPNSGTADRIGIAAAVAAPGSTAAVTAASALLYSPAGVKYMVNGLRGALPAPVVAQLESLPPHQAIAAIAQLAERSPEIGNMAYTLAGQLVTQQGDAQ